MATDATGTPTTNFSIPTFNTAVDKPSGKGFNAAMAVIDTALLTVENASVSKPSGIISGEAVVWNGTGWARSSVTKITTSNLSGYPSDGTKFLAGDGTWTAPSSTPAGTIMQYGGSSAPVGYLLCDGSAVSRTTFASLFTAISTTYGSGDGSTTFNVPDFVGRVPVGLSASGPLAINTLGKNDGVTKNNRNVSHHHIISGGSSGGGSSSNNALANNLPSSNTSGDANNTDSPAFLVVNYIIKT